MTPSRFRFLLIASLVTGLIGPFLDIVFPSLVPEALSQAQTNYDADYSVPMLIFIAVGTLVMLIGGIVSAVGLYLFKPWAPRFSIILTVAAIAYMPVFGGVTNSGLSFTVIELSNILWGVLLTVAYVTPIRERFAGVK
ncbi:MAG TPA: hypothetical protein VGO72_00720 [Herminiimonas sp.]|nr:hypothetical protein [Herminiimonas sp.]